MSYLKQFTYRKNLFSAMVLAIACWGLSADLLAGKDILVLKNGDRITGEVKKLDQADLHFDADYGENIFIVDWNEVDLIESAGHAVPLPQSEVVFLNPVDSTFWSRLGVSVDFGLSLTKAQNTRQFNTRTAVSYLTDK